MNKRRQWKAIFLSGIVLSLAGVIVAQTAANKTLVVNGTSAGSAVREIDGHTYVEIEALARVTNGVVTIEPTRVLLSIPVGGCGNGCGAREFSVSSAAGGGAFCGI